MQFQTAVRLLGPNRLRLHHRQAIPRPAATQIVAEVECVGLCYSDVKLMRQFGAHARKSAVIAHLAADVLAEIPSYAPGEAPTVPGHEVVLRVRAVGSAVTSVAVGGRYVVQADFRHLATAAGNGAFGYNFEGGLQQYVLLDERVTIGADDESHLVPVPDHLAASQLALIEPWACVEQAFGTRERRHLRPGGTLLIVGTGRLDGVDTSGSTIVTEAALGTVDDLLYGGTDPDELERLFPLVAKDGLILLASGGGRFGRPVDVPVGRVHYGNIRIAASASDSFADCLASIPVGGGLRGGDRVSVAGAGGPMGVMAVVHAITSSRPGAIVEAGVRDRHRASALRDRTAGLAAERGIDLRLFDSRPDGPVDYCMLMAPEPLLVQEAIEDAADRGIINVFAGIAVDVACPIDLDRYAQRQLYFIGTSGSTIRHMRAMLARIVAGQLDTNISVGAIGGMAGAVDGLAAVRDRAVAGKVVIYPALVALPLLTLDEVADRYPTVGALMSDGRWNAAAETELLRLG